MHISKQEQILIYDLNYYNSDAVFPTKHVDIRVFITAILPLSII